MRPLSRIETEIETVGHDSEPVAAASELLALGEEVLEHWIVAKREEPTSDTREGFRLLALHRQGARGDPSFNACRETCREIAYHYNLVTMRPDDPETGARLGMMRLIVNHLFLFVSGKMQVAELGEFCCSSKPIRLAPEQDARNSKEA